MSDHNPKESMWQKVQLLGFGGLLSMGMTIALAPKAIAENNSELQQQSVQINRPETRQGLTFIQPVQLPTHEILQSTVVQYSQESYINFQVGRGMGEGMDIGRTECAATSAVMFLKILNKGDEKFNRDLIGGKPGEKEWSDQEKKYYQFSGALNKVVRGSNIDNPADVYGVVKALKKFGVKSQILEGNNFSPIKLKTQIDAGQPVIMGFEKNRYFESKFNNVFSHFVVVVGYIYDSNGKMLLVTHDPNNNAWLMKGWGKPSDSGETSGKFSVIPYPTSDGAKSEGFSNPVFVIKI